MTRSWITVPRHRDELAVQRRRSQPVQTAVPIAISDEQEIARIRRATSQATIVEVRRRERARAAG